MFLSLNPRRYDATNSPVARLRCLPGHWVSSNRTSLTMPSTSCLRTMGTHHKQLPVSATLQALKSHRRPATRHTYFAPRNRTGVAKSLRHPFFYVARLYLGRRETCRGGSPHSAVLRGAILTVRFSDSPHQSPTHFSRSRNISPSLQWLHIAAYAYGTSNQSFARTA